MDPDKKLKQMSERSRNAKGKVKRRDFMSREDEEEDGEEEEEEEEENLARAWQQSSRIFRVSGSGGKDRHSKVYTTKGLRDRRVRLSVSTAIQFYDLQDRLGYDRPSKAVEWLIKAAADAIAELPPLNGTFSNGIVPRHQQELQHSSPHNDSFCESGKEEESGREEWVMVDRGGCEADPELDLTTHRHFSANLTKSACSSTSETSKGSVLSLSRSESRVKARERARERAKEREKVDISTATTVSTGQHALSSHGAGSFTDLLMDVNVSQHNPGFSQKVRKQVVSGDGRKRAETAGEIVPFASPAMDYLSAGVFSSDFLQASKNHHHNHPSSGQSQFGSPLPLMSIVPFNNPSGFMGSVDHHPELQQFSFFQDRVIPVASSNDNNLNFSMSSLTAGHNRGTLQSNSSLLPHIQKVSSPISVDGGPSMPFFIPTAHAAAAVAAANQFPGALDGRLQLYYGDGCRHLDPKGKGKG